MNKLRYDTPLSFKNNVISRSLFEAFEQMDDTLTDLLLPFLLVPVNASLLTQDERDLINTNYHSFKSIAKRLLYLVTEAYKQDTAILDMWVVHQIKEKAKIATETYTLSNINTLADKSAKKVTVAFRLYDMLIGKLMTAFLMTSIPKYEV